MKIIIDLNKGGQLTVKALPPRRNKNEKYPTDAPAKGLPEVENNQTVKTTIEVRALNSDKINWRLII